MQQVKSKASTVSESWQRIGNIDPFFVTAAPTVANASFSTSVCAIPAINAKNGREQEKQNRKKHTQNQFQLLGIILEKHKTYNGILLPISSNQKQKNTHKLEK